jgi:hypothetical protein
MKYQANSGSKVSDQYKVFEDADVIAGLLTRFDTLRNEAFRGSESLALIERMCEQWTASGARAVTRAPTAGNA